MRAGMAWGVTAMFWLLARWVFQSQGAARAPARGAPPPPPPAPAAAERRGPEPAELAGADDLEPAKDVNTLCAEIEAAGHKGGARKQAAKERRRAKRAAAAAAAAAATAAAAAATAAAAEADAAALRALVIELNAPLPPPRRVYDPVAAQRRAAAQRSAAAAAKDAEAAEAAKPAAAECDICLDAPRAAVAIPCGHANLCAGCAHACLDGKCLCPTCRAPLDGYWLQELGTTLAEPRRAPKAAPRC
jgi:hypothetical protein